ncbi:unnamed protein product [Closterium sp. NIES-53]
MHNGASRANRLRTPTSKRTAVFYGATLDSRSAATLALHRPAVLAGRLSAVLARLLYATLAGGRPCCGGTGAGAAGCTRADGAGGAAGVGAGGTGAGCAGPGNAGAVGAGSGDTGRLRPYFVPPASVASPPPAPSPYTKHTGGLKVRCEHVSRPASPVRAVCTGHRVPHPRPPHVPGTHHMALRPSSVPQRVSLPSPPASSLTNNPDPESDFLRAARPTISRLLATVVTEPSFESAAASALVVELVDFAAACRLDYAASLVAESESFCPPSVRGEYALCTDVLEDKHEDFKCFGAVVPHLVSMLHAPEGDQDAPDIPTSRSYAEAITGPYPSHWQTTMDAEIAFWKVKRPPGSPPAFKARYVARGFRQRQEVDFFKTFSPTPKMTTLQVLLHVAAQRDYELHSLDFNTSFVQGSLHEEIWLRRPPGFTRLCPARTQWSLLRPVYSLRQGVEGVWSPLPILFLSFPLLQLPLEGGCEGVGEPGEWHWGGGFETNQQPSRHLSSLPPSAAPAAVWGGGGGGG